MTISIGRTTTFKPFDWQKLFTRERKTSMSQLQKRDAVLHALRAEKQLDEEDIWVRPQNGFIFLTGTVSSLEHKRLAGRTAANVVGASEVINELKVRY
jgi:osmotically-inducible protein OsmY